MIHRGQLTVRRVDADPKELLNVCYSIEPSTDNPGDVICPGSEDNEAGEENLPEPDPDQSPRRIIVPDFALSSKDEVAQFETVGAAAAVADIHETECKETITPSRPMNQKDPLHSL